jgi:hypothetical protein
LAAAPGAYSFSAAYAGDSNYNAIAAGTHNPETFFVDKATLAIATTIHNDTGDAMIANGSAIALNSGVHDSATVSNIVGGIVPANSVVFTFFRGSQCGAGSEAAGTVALGAITAGSATAHPSSSKTSLTAGQYSFQASIADDTNYTGATSGCEPFSVNKVNTITATDIHLDGTHAVVTSVGLGASVHDSATVSGQMGTIAIAGTVSFTFFMNNTCAGTGTSAGSPAVSLGVAHPSNSTGSLPAGSYSFKAHYNGDDNYNGSDALCEPLTVSKGSPGITTDVHDQNEASVPLNGVVSAGTSVHDKATLTGLFPFQPTGNAAFTFYTNGTCSGIGTAAGNPAVALDGSSYVAHPSSTESSLTPGSYSFKASYSGDSNYTGATSGCEPFSVIQKSLVTDSALCTFDVDSGTAGNQFRLLYTPDQNNPSAWKLNASNPGQYYYNVFFNDVGPQTVTLTLPYPFVTQGAVPIHIYSGVTTTTVNGQTCLIPGTEIGHQTNQVVLADYVPDALGKTVNVTFTSPTGFAYVNIHLDYGLKGTNNYSKDANNNAIDATTLAIRIPDNQNYTFAFDYAAQNGTASVSSRNVFKRDPGIAGLVLKTGTNEPVQGAQVRITGDGQTATVTTDEDGWYMWQYKYTGKATPFTVALLQPYNQSQTVTLKSNGFVVLSFTVP